MAKKGRLVWIDITRAVCIVLICLIHMRGVIYDSYILEKSFYFSVGFLLIISGYVTYKSTAEKGLVEAYLKAFYRFIEIVVLYVLASFIYIIYHDRQFDFPVFIKHLKDFSASGPLYYFAFYLQYIIIGPLLVKIVKLCSSKNRNSWLNTLCFLAVTVVATLCVLYTRIGNIFAGGNMVLGGTHLIVFYLGMLIACVETSLYKVLRHILVRILLTVLTIGWGYAYAYGYLPFDRWFKKLWLGGTNPPGFSLIILASLAMLTCMAWFKGFNNHSGIWSPFIWIGQNTLFIFMFHILVMDILLDRAFIEQNIHFVWMKILLLIVIIVSCALAETGYKKLKHSIKRESVD